MLASAVEGGIGHRQRRPADPSRDPSLTQEPAQRRVSPPPISSVLIVEEFSIVEGFPRETVLLGTYMLIVWWGSVAPSPRPLPLSSSRASNTICDRPR
jgi:hypothetical protein